MFRRIFYLVSSVILIVLAVFAFPYARVLITETLLLGAAHGIVRTQTLLAIPMYSLVGGVILQLIVIIVGFALLFRVMLLDTRPRPGAWDRVKHGQACDLEF